MDRQDFEQYARVKTFNESVADTWSEALREVLQWTGRPLSDVRFLDHGCGDGKYYRYLVRLGLTPQHVHGVEISRIRIERCRALGWLQAVCIEKGGRLPYPDDHFDVVNLMEVIEHIPRAEIGGVLAEIRRVLRPEGVLMGSTPNYPVKRVYDLYDAVVFRKWNRVKDDPTHVTFYNHDRLRRLLAPHFRRVETRCFKTGFLYRRLVQSPYVMHKILFLCRDKADGLRADGRTQA